MANTRVTATNTFTKGLMMDLHPLVAADGTYTNALNATFLTFNGNEGQFQQDMGNGRVETAYLPEGYIPIGTCEYGDIIYIVSYNPLENKSQIGCFPSPERNITSDEISDIEQAISGNDFQELVEDANGNVKATGKLKSLSVKKILYGNNKMNPGDFFSIYTEDSEESISKYKDQLSDYGVTTHEHNVWPKLIKLQVVSIEDSGKIVNLNSSVKWYDNNYYINSQTISASGSADIDSYRSLVSSAYSVFQSKVTGKLAIIAELESIDSFNCSYKVFTKIDKDNEGNEIVNYNIYLYTSWETSDPNIVPIGYSIVDRKWVNADNNPRYYKAVKNTAFYYDEDGNYILLDSEKDDGTSSIEEISLPSVYENSYDDDTYYSVERVVPYSRTYELEKAPDTYEEFLKNCYQTRIQDTLTWKDSYLENSNDWESVKNNLSLINSAINILDAKTQEPSNKYGFNIKTWGKDKEGIHYYTYDTKGNLVAIKPLTLNDDIIVNSFNKEVIKKLDNFSFSVFKNTTVTEENTDRIKDHVVYEQTVTTYDYSEAVLQLDIVPAMPYGLLDNFKSSLYIDFSKINSGDINLIAWKYYSSDEDILTISWQLEAYPEPNKGIAEVTFDFYDNLGFAAGYHITNKESYSGTFTENIPLNKQFSRYNLDNKNFKGEISKRVIVDGTTETEVKDSGTLYSNWLYLVKITVQYTTTDILGNYDTTDTSFYKTFYEWVWTNGVFNDYYYNTNDFTNLSFTVGIGSLLKMDARNLQKTTKEKLGTSDTTLRDSITTKYVETSITASGDENNTYVHNELENGLLYTYNVFKISKDASFNRTVYIGEERLTRSDDITLLSTASNSDTLLLNNILDVYKDYGEVSLKFRNGSQNITSEDKTIIENTLDENGENIQISDKSNYVKLYLNSDTRFDTIFSANYKDYIFHTRESKTIKVLEPLLRTENDFKNLGIYQFAGHWYFDNNIVFCGREKGSKHPAFIMRSYTGGNGSRIGKLAKERIDKCPYKYDRYYNFEELSSEALIAPFTGVIFCRDIDYENTSGALTASSSLQAFRNNVFGKTADRLVTTTETDVALYTYAVIDQISGQHYFSNQVLPIKFKNNSTYLDITLRNENKPLYRKNTIADYIAGTLASILVVKNQSSQKSFIPKDLFYLSPHQVTFKKNIIVKTVYIKNNNEIVPSFLYFYNTKYSEYLETVFQKVFLEKLKLSDFCKKYPQLCKNIIPEIQNTSQVFVFEYAHSYDISSAITSLELEKTSISGKYIKPYTQDESYGTEHVLADIEPVIGKLYAYNHYDDSKVTLLEDYSNIACPETFSKKGTNIYMTYSKEAKNSLYIPTNNLKNLNQILQYGNSTVQFSNLNVLDGFANKSNIGMYARGKRTQDWRIIYVQSNKISLFVNTFL